MTWRCASAARWCSPRRTRAKVRGRARGCARTRACEHRRASAKEITPTDETTRPSNPPAGVLAVAGGIGISPIAAMLANAAECAATTAAGGDQALPRAPAPALALVLGSHWPRSPREVPRLPRCPPPTPPLPAAAAPPLPAGTRVLLSALAATAFLPGDVRRGPRCTRHAHVAHTLRTRHAHATHMHMPCACHAHAIAHAVARTVHAPSHAAAHHAVALRGDAPRTSLHLPTSPHISPHLPISPHISPHLPTSPTAQSRFEAMLLAQRGEGTAAVELVHVAPARPTRRPGEAASRRSRTRAVRLGRIGSGRRCALRIGRPRSGRGRGLARGAAGAP
mgnify:CR=1 FL=1